MPPDTSIRRRRKEEELLISCARTRLDAATAERAMELVQQGIDWHAVLRLADRHAILPLLHQSLAVIGTDSVPVRVLDTLRERFRVHAARSVLAAAELRRLIDLFEAACVPALPYKGPLLAVSTYGNLLLRPFGDLDVLVPKQHIRDARRLLVRGGYRPDPEMNSQDEARYLRTHHDYKFVRPGCAVVEVQWGVTQQRFPFPLDFRRLWERRVPVVLAGRKVPGLHPEDLLPILCVHGLKHGWDCMKWICDIHELVRAHPELNWKAVMADARRRGGERMVLLGLVLAHRLLDTALPEPLRGQILNDYRLDRLAAHFANRLFAPSDVPHRVEDERPVLYIRVRERWRDKLYLVRYYGPAYARRAVVPNERDRAFVRLPRMLSLLYWVVRPIRLVARYCASYSTRGQPLPHCIADP